MKHLKHLFLLVLVLFFHQTLTFASPDDVFKERGVWFSYNSSFSSWSADSAETYIDTLIISHDGKIRIRDNAFQNHQNLEFAQLSRNVERIGNFAFDGCEKLDSVCIKDYSTWYPDKLREIGSCAFRNCTSLRVVEGLPNIFESIGAGAFLGCTNLKEVKFPEHLSHYWGISLLGNGSHFRDCTSLETMNIGYFNKLPMMCFMGCTSLKNVTGSVKEMHYAAFANCISLEEYIGNWTDVVNEAAFSGCISLKRAGFSNYMKRMSNKVFYDCQSLESFHIPDSTNNIGFKCFSGCTSLTEITIPEKVVSVDDNILERCPNLLRVTSLNPVPPHCAEIYELLKEDGITDLTHFGDGTYDGIPSIVDDDSDCVLYVPKGAKEAYAAAPGWSLFKTIIEIGDVETMVNKPSFDEERCSVYDTNGKLFKRDVPCEDWQKGLPNGNYIVKVKDKAVKVKL